jgi:hypothetical protein
LVDAVRKSTAPVTLLPNEFRSCGADGSLLTVQITVAEHRVGHLHLSGHAEGTLLIEKMWVHEDLQHRGYGRAAMDLVRTVARKEKYLRLAGEVEPGTPEVMQGRRIFAEKCAFKVNKDDTLEMEIKAGAP